ncbi:hypothetical protein [Bradyrhizobium sp. LMTR 3]|uniref:hypothetical protein n=1 Tax=Bradyrhizobium sp. LMTR 3 TaxID=189873 RepID=UPI0008104B81|nr:hypothetical protein [Bradyrhizobium sp. LMTR 3]OCK55930.1 hypothetical protein LMTR3_34125 [Bradyrhizobium sp. LMTR 3]
MYRRANLSRILVLVVGLLLAAVSTGVFARGFPAADPRNAGHWIEMFHSRQFGAEQDRPGQTWTGAIDLHRTNVALIGTVAPLLVGRLRRVEWI